MNRKTLSTTRGVKNAGILADLETFLQLVLNDF